MVEGPLGVPRPFAKNKTQVEIIFSRSTQRSNKAVGMVKRAVESSTSTQMAVDGIFHSSREGSTVVTFSLENPGVLKDDLDNLESSLESMMAQSDVSLGNILAITVR